MYKTRQKKPWRRIPGRKKRGRTVPVRRLCLALLLGELLWLGRERGDGLAARWEASGVEKLPAEAAGGREEDGKPGWPARWLGFGVDLREGKIHFFRREEQVVN